MSADVNEFFISEVTDVSITLCWEIRESGPLSKTYLLTYFKNGESVDIEKINHCTEKKNYIVQEI